MHFQSRHIFLIFLGLVLCFSKVAAQNKDKNSLQLEYNKILNEIKDIEDLLGKTKDERKESLEQLQSLQRKISSRSNLIANIQEQADFIQNNIDEKKSVVVAMKKDLSALKESYSTMVYHSYKNLHAKNRLAFIFSAESFNQALSRFNYLRTYSKYRENQSVLIDKTIVDIEEKVALLEAEKEEKQTLIAQENIQNSLLETEKQKKNALVEQLKQDESDLAEQVKKKNQDAADLSNKIQEIIAEEIRLAKLKAAENNTSDNASSLGLTPQEKALSSNFISNKGNLPWPVLKGHIVGTFGKQEHPTIPKVYINNNGIDIRTETGSDVRTVFDGTVVSSFYLPTTQNSVIIKHGEYYTVYSNLKNVTVKAGENLVTKQSIGEVYTSDVDQTTKVHFEVWQGTEKINPMLWLVN